jgi:hypothetical protein
MPLTGKYLKYSPEITLEIFTLVCDKLKKTGLTSMEAEDNYDYFSGRYNYLINVEQKYYYTREEGSPDLVGKTETTVQEILGYDPFEKDELVQTSMSQHDACNTCKFYSNCDNAPEDCTAVNGQHYPKDIVKDDFVLPEKWFIRCTNESKRLLDKWTGFTFKYINIYYDDEDGKTHSDNIIPDYTEITFEQFQKYVLKTTEQPKVMEKSYNTIGKEELLDWNKASEGELLEEAKRRYPIGTVFSPAHVNSTHKCIVTNFNFVTTKRQSKTIGVAILTDDKEYYSGDSKYGDTAYDRLVYSDGKWAKIISLPETKVESKEVIPEYVECIFGYEGQFTKGKIYKLTPTKSIYQYEVENCDNGLRNAWMKQHFKPSTKEAFDTQNKPKSIEKWSVGSYIVFLQDEVLTRSGRVTKGKPYVLTESGICPYFKDDNINQINFNSNASESYGLKWFATLHEAEEFAKTLVESVREVIQLTEFPIEGYCKTDNKELRRYLTKRPNITLSEEPKWIEGKSIGVGWNGRSHWIISEKSNKPEYQLNQLERFFTKEEVKQAVHCCSQEEWDFVQSKINYKFINKWIKNENNCINLETKNSCADYSHYKSENYQILSFQEWCDLNGYKMEKEVKFEVGKWYKSSEWPDFWIKCSNFNGNEISVNEVINIGEHIVKNDKYTYLLDTYTQLTDLSKIQQYLPDGHPDKIKVDREFKVGDWVTITKSNQNWNDCMDRYVGKVVKITSISSSTSIEFEDRKHWSFLATNGHFRHATLEEINNHLISIGQIPAELGNQESEKYQLKPLHPDDLTWEIETPTFITNLQMGVVVKDPFYGVMGKPGSVKTQSIAKTILSIDDEELPMVNIIKTKTINLLNNE